MTKYSLGMHKVKGRLRKHSLFIRCQEEDWQQNQKQNSVVCKEHLAFIINIVYKLENGIGSNVLEGQENKLVLTIN